MHLFEVLCHSPRVNFSEFAAKQMNRKEIEATAEEKTRNFYKNGVIYETSGRVGQ